MKRGFLSAFLLLFCYCSSALMITPGSLEMEFVPNREYDCSFVVKAKEETNLIVYARGELNQSISFSKNKLKAIPGEWNSIECKIKMPGDIKPGLNKNFVGVVEDVGGKGAVGGITGVETILYIRKPFPGKYLELEKFVISDAEVNEDVNFVIDVINRGAEKINDAYALIEIYDENKKIGQIETENIEIEGKGSLYGEWETNNAGKYNALAKINYDGSILEAEKGFNVNEFIIKIISISEPSVKKGDIARFDVVIQSHWNKIIKDVYMELGFVGEEDTTLTESIEIDSWEKKTISGYLETSNLDEGEYEVNVKVYYGDKSAEDKTKLLVTKKISLSTFTILVMIIIVLILLFATNLIRFKKWKGKKRLS